MSLKPINYNNELIALVDVPPEIVDLPADWHDEAAMSTLTTESPEDQLAQLQLLEALAQHQMGFITTEQLKEYM